MKQRFYFIICFFMLAGLLPAEAQLNAPEKILLDSFSIYPEFGFHTDSGYLIGGEERSCNIATIWKLDEDFNVIDKKQLIHKHYEISEVYDMRVTDSAIQVLTRQLEIEDVVSDDGIKLYSLNTDLDIIDSIFIPNLNSYDGLLSDSTLIIKTWTDSLYRISARDGSTRLKVRLDYTSNPLMRFNSQVVSWQDTMIFVIDSVLNIDTVYMSDKVQDVATSENIIYALTSSLVLAITKNDAYSVTDTITSPEEARRILYHPYLRNLVVFAAGNKVYYYDTDLLDRNGTVQLFFDPVYEEDLNYYALKDGSILRCGTTLTKIKIQKNVLYGQEFGFVHRFDQHYSEDSVSRSNVSLTELSLFDTYYNSKPKFILGDTTYIITKDHDSELKWKVSNVGSDTIHSTLVATNSLWGFNCAVGFNSHFFHDLSFYPGDSLERVLTVYKNSDFPDGYTLKRFVYTAFPNDHYDMDFSDNLKSFKLRYILSSTDDGPDPQEIKVYPIPAENEIHITCNGDLTIRQAELLNIQGKVFVNTKVDHPQSDLWFNISSVPAGIYLLRLQTPKGDVVKKVSVIR